MQGSEDAQGQRPPFLKRAGKAIGKLFHWGKEHGTVSAEGSKKGSERFDATVEVGASTNKRVKEDQENWEATHPGHEFPGSGMNGFR